MWQERKRCSDLSISLNCHNLGDKSSPHVADRSDMMGNPQQAASEENSQHPFLTKEFHEKKIICLLLFPWEEKRERKQFTKPSHQFSTERK